MIKPQWLTNLQSRIFNMPDTTTTTIDLTAKPHRSLLQIIGADVEGVFNFLASRKGQVLVQTGEAIVETEFPLAAGAINVFNDWFAEILKSEALAAAAGKQDGTGPQKAVIAFDSIEPQVLEFVRQHGLAAPTADKLKLINDSLTVAFNTLTEKDAAPAKAQF